MVHDEGLEKVGGGNLDKLIEKIKARYPNHNFDIPPPPDTKCKQEYDCKKLGNITYRDMEGNIYCGKRYKQTNFSTRIHLHLPQPPLHPNQYLLL